MAEQLSLAQEEGANVTSVFGHVNADQVEDFTSMADGPISVLASASPSIGFQPALKLTE